MGGEEDLWDDSALVNAFNDALSKYKIMHSQGGNVSSTEEGKAISGREENLSTLSDQSHEARSSEKVNDGNAASSMKMETGEAGSPISENHHVESGDPDKIGKSLNGLTIQDEETESLSSQRLEHYNQLLSKYYELEDQRQKVLQQLNQYGYGDYNNPTGWDYQNITPATFTSQEHQAYATQPFYSTMACACCPYGCQVVAAPGPSLPACGLVAGCGDTGNASSRAEGKEKEVDCKGENSCDSDFDVVMNAWYTAGFYTGKYLAEQKRQG